VQRLVMAAIAGLRSPGKGANKRRRMAAFRPSPGPGVAGFTATAHRQWTWQSEGSVLRLFARVG